MSVVLHCHNCADERRLPDAEMLAALQVHGMLRRETRPEATLMRELLLSIADQLSCTRCGSIGVAVKDDWAEEWEDEVKCEGCQAVIPAERLEVFPDTKFCPACQAKRESGEDVNQAIEYCIRCGGIMKLTKRGGAGLAGYRMVCGDCGKAG